MPSSLMPQTAIFGIKIEFTYLDNCKNRLLKNHILSIFLIIQLQFMWKTYVKYK